MSEYSRLFDGWLTRYKLNRPLNKYELANRLNIEKPIDLPPLDKGIIKLNSNFIEYVDRYFFGAAGRQWGGTCSKHLAVFHISSWHHDIRPI